MSKHERKAQKRAQAAWNLGHSAYVITLPVNAGPFGDRILNETIAAVMSAGWSLSGNIASTRPTLLLSTVQHTVTFVR